MHAFNTLKIHHHISAKILLCLTFRAVKCITSCNPLCQTFKLSYKRDVKVDNLYSLPVIKENISAFRHVLYLCWHKSFNWEESIHSRLQVLSDSMERNLETRFYSIITYLSVLGIPEYYAMFLTIRLVKCIHYCIWKIAPLKQRNKQRKIVRY